VLFQRLFIPIAIALLLPEFILAQSDARRIKVDVRKPLRLDYQSAAWNKDPEKVETSVLLIRDAKTGRTAKVEVTESGRDTGLFLGFYQLNFQSGENQDPEMTPEVYVIPPKLAEDKNGMAAVTKMISDGRLLRKPFFLRIENRSVQAISVYDTKDQALEAYQGFLKTGSGRQIIDRAAMAAAQQAEQSDELKARLQAEAKAESDRARMQAEEAQKQEEALKRAAKMDANVKALRVARGKELGEQALAHYKKEEYQAAESKFAAAIEQDPENKSYNFQYGITLYRLEKFQQSLVILNLVKESDVNPSELLYFRGLNYLKLNELNGAYRSFLDVKNRGDANMAPAGGFFAGVIDFQSSRYDSAKALFEYVLDTSKDPEMDQQAESYLEQIANIRQFEELQKTKFFINANLGLILDSNILSQSAANAPTDLAGFRWMYGGSVEYRPVYTQTHELSLAMAVNDMYSQDQQFNAKTEFQNTDPLVAAFTLPYRWKSSLFGNGYQLSLVPGYENIQLNADGVGTREAILNSTVLDIDQTLVMSEDWFSTYALELRKDASLITAPAEENQSATKITFVSSQAWFFDQKKTKALIWDLGYATNNAEGVNQKYNRIDFAFTYLYPVTEMWSGTGRMAFYNSKYGEHLTGRTDNNISMTIAGRRALEKLLFVNVAFTYMKNNSIDAFTYDKYSLMTFLSWDQNF